MVVQHGSTCSNQSLHFAVAAAVNSPEAEASTTTRSSTQRQDGVRPHSPKWCLITRSSQLRDTHGVLYPSGADFVLFLDELEPIISLRGTTRYVIPYGCSATGCADQPGETESSEVLGIDEFASQDEVKKAIGSGLGFCCRSCSAKLPHLMLLVQLAYGSCRINYRSVC